MTKDEKCLVKKQDIKYWAEDDILSKFILNVIVYLIILL